MHQLLHHSREREQEAQLPRRVAEAQTVPCLQGLLELWAQAPLLLLLLKLRQAQQQLMLSQHLPVAGTHQLRHCYCCLRWAHISGSREPCQRLHPPPIAVVQGA